MSTNHPVSLEFVSIFFQSGIHLNQIGGCKSNFHILVVMENAGSHVHIPSMYGIFPYIWFIFMANVGKYTIHGCYGIDLKRGNL